MNWLKKKLISILVPNYSELLDCYQNGIIKDIHISKISKELKEVKKELEIIRKIDIVRKNL